MILGFMQQFPWSTKKSPTPTNFREKILAGAHQSHEILLQDGRITAHKLVGLLRLHPKIHTMREDPHNRWKAGRKIEMVYRGAGYKIIDHFNKGIPELGNCKSTQQIRIAWSGDDSEDIIGVLSKAIGIQRKHLVIIVDGKEVAEFTFTDSAVGSTDPQSIIKKDGFDDPFQFAKWFKKDWSGKIIHWTDFRY